jgi:cell division inhibitor SulA
MSVSARRLELTDEELLLLTQAMETGEAEELALRLGRDKHEAFVDLRGRLQDESSGLDHRDL